MVSREFKICIADHHDTVELAIWKQLSEQEYTHVTGLSSSELDLRDQKEATAYFETEKPNVVIDAAIKVRGILSNNSYPYQYMMENIQIQNNLNDTLLKENKIEKFIFLVSSGMLFQIISQSLKENYLMTDFLEAINL